MRLENFARYYRATARNPMQNLHKSAVMLSPNDSTALEMAVEKVRSTVRAGELADLFDERGWQSAAMVAAYDCQCRALRLPVWEEPPCAARPTDKGKAGRLLRRMLARGVSRYHPDPLAAIACAVSATRRVAVAAPNHDVGEPDLMAGNFFEGPCGKFTTKYRQI